MLFTVGVGGVLMNDPMELLECILSSKNASLKLACLLNLDNQNKLLLLV